MGPVGGNGDNGGRDTHRFSDTNHIKVGASEGGRYVVYTKGRGSAGSSGNLVGKNLNWTNTGEIGTVGGSDTNIQGMHKGCRLCVGRG